MWGRWFVSKTSTVIIHAVWALWPGNPARAGDLPTSIHEVAVIEPKAQMSVPSTPFHLVLRGRMNGDEADMLLDVMVFPATRQITGMLRSRGPDNVLTHLSGGFERDGASIEAHLTGFPPLISGCFGHGLPVSKIAEADVLVDTGWRTGKVTLAYKGGSPFDPAGDWKTTTEMPVGDGDPLPWRGVDDIRWADDAPLAWKNDPCFASDHRERVRLAKLGSDASRHLLQLSDRPARSFVPWTVRNDSTHHILALVTCAGHDKTQAPLSSDVLLLHPRETRPLNGFNALADVTCTVTRSHVDD